MIKIATFMLTTLKIMIIISLIIVVNPIVTTYINTTLIIRRGKVKHELRATSYEFKFTNYEFKFTSYEFKFTS